VLVNDDQLSAVGVSCRSLCSAVWKSPKAPKSSKDPLTSRSSARLGENVNGSSPVAAVSENGPNPSSCFSCMSRYLCGKELARTHIIGGERIIEAVLKGDIRGSTKRVLNTQRYPLGVTVTEMSGLTSNPLGAVVVDSESTGCECMLNVDRVSQPPSSSSSSPSSSKCGVICIS
jgi:hypothetical protein